MAYFLMGGDRVFLTERLLPYFGIKRVKVEWNSSRKHWPDIWCFPREVPPRIVVTQEWLRQPSEERKKRLVHEALHLIGMNHGKVGSLDYNTRPSRDSYSKQVYQRIKEGAYV